MEVREAIASPRTLLEPYSELAKVWHERGKRLAGDYGAYARFLIQERAIEPRRALDLACGTGVTTEALAALFGEVTGLDLSPHMILQARACLGRLSNVEIVEGDFRAFTFDRTFDLVTCSGDSLNYAQTPDQLLQSFLCVADVLSPSGVFVFDLQPQHLPFLDRVAVRHDDGRAGFYQVHAYDRSTRVDTSHVIWPFGVETHRRRIFTAPEVAGAAERAQLVRADRLDGWLLRFLSVRGPRRFWAFRRG